jgi:AraC-like DNA-binding protein
VKKRGDQIDLIGVLVPYLERAGGSLDQLLSMSGLDHVPARVEREQSEMAAVTMLRNAIELTKDPVLPLRLGRHFDIGNLGAYGFAIMSCADVEQCLRLMTRYQKTLGMGPRWQVLDQGHDPERGVLVRAVITLGSPDQLRLVLELVFSQFCRGLEFLIDGPLKGAELHLNYPPSDHANEYQRLLPVKVRFDQPHCQLLLPRKLLKRHVRTANAAGHVVFQQQCEELLRNLNKVEDTSAAVRRVLLHSAEFPGISQVAEILHVSERTLRRRLSGESKSFRGLTEQVKHTLAQEYLGNTHLTVPEIAHLLSYTEAVNFRQAFVRWQGVTPSQYRRTRRSL